MPVTWDDTLSFTISTKKEEKEKEEMEALGSFLFLAVLAYALSKKR